MEKFLSLGIELNGFDDNDKLQMIRDLQLSKKIGIDGLVQELIIITRSEKESQRVSHEIKRFNLSVPTHVIHPHSTTKLWSLSTLFAEAAMGDQLVYLRQYASAYDVIEFLENGSRRHLTWLYSASHSKNLYHKINQAYGRNLMPKCTIGYSISRQALNMAMRANENIYDMFVELATLFKGEYDSYPLETLGQKVEVYSRIEMNRVLLKVSGSYQPSHFHWPILTIVIWMLTFSMSLNIVKSLEIDNLGAIFSIIILSYLLLTILNGVIDSIIISRQALAGIDRKKISGWAIRQTLIG